tara:strand:+ start:210 stop:566 length:357 start_codon:yes stop_codon:yes gene_type:complete
MILLTSYITINLAIQHKEPTAISQIGQYLNKKNEPLIIISLPLINYYLKSQNLMAEYIDVENNTTINLSMNDNRPIFIIGNITNAIKNLDIVSDTLFYHNPYVNRMWSQIYLSSNKEL